MSAHPSAAIPQPPDARLARRQALLSCAIIRNIAFYYAGWISEDGRGQLKDDTELGRTINSNFIDMAVLEWAKLFVDARGRHHWYRFVRSVEARTAFRTGLLANIGLDLPAWEQYHEDVRVYRDRFIAHLDDDDVMTPPRLRLARDSTLFFYENLAANAPVGAIAGRLPHDLRDYYDACTDLASTYHVSYVSDGI
ncbi:hypothetical protein [Burkholderia ambifaria]|uniref:hypothetical protein n=1 Tax=Burkholderia ambifaria TaxID=152480 RepID=UPI00158C9CDA|nr:hypothetical protein [Burkholderia ambifaria]